MEEASKKTYVAAFKFDEASLLSCESWFDVAALCFHAIINAKVDQELWIARFFESSGQTEHNPNINELNCFKLEVMERVMTSWHDIGTSYGHDAIDWLLHRLSSFQLEQYESDSENALTPLFSILLGIDLACQELDEVRSLRQKGPLNRLACTGEISVFLESDDCMVKDAVERRGLTFPADLTINGQLASLRFQLMGFEARCRPSIIRVEPPQLPNAVTDRLVIGMVPFTRASVICDEAGQGPVRLLHGNSVAFSVSYDECYEQRYSKGVRWVIERAIEEKCDILVFPELVISPGLLQLIQSTLRELNGEHSLSLIVAGSTWEGGNNVCTLINAYGYAIGTCHKRHPYIASEKEADMADEDEWPLFSTGARLVEDLRDPGDTCTLVDVPGFGRVLVVICKDMASSSLYMSQLVRDYRPQLVICPSLSESLDKGFLSQSSFMSGQFYSISCVCNLCGARSEKAEARGGIGMVTAPSLEVEGEVAFTRLPAEGRIRRAEGCNERDDCYGACLRTITVDYGSIVDGNNVPEIVVSEPITLS